MAERKKKVKPIPDVECLKYHGTKSKPDIKIFVSHRIDLDAETIDNPLYIPVRCGAVYDKRKGITMLGDDTGDNISEKRNSFNELTVQYWAWKNIKADYYGLCHYRRYLSFAEEKFDTSKNLNQHVEANYLDSVEENTYNLLSSKTQAKLISKYDGMVIDPIDITKVSTPKGYAKNILEHWQNMENALISNDSLSLFFDVFKSICGVKEYNSLLDYLYQTKYYGFNCFILRKDLFFKLCEFEFPILFKFNSKLNTKYLSETELRVPGFFGEILSGFFIWKKIFDVGVVYGYVNSNISLCISIPKSHKLKSKKRNELIGLDTINKLIDILEKSIKNQTESKQVHIIIKTLYYTGMRPAELFALNRDDINYRDRTININKELGYDNKRKSIIRTCKTNKSHRIIPIPKKLYLILLELKDRKGIMFLDKNGGYYNCQNIGNRYHQIAKRNGIDFHLYQCRHTFITNLYLKGVDLKTIQELCGQTVNTTTIGYVVTNDKRKRNSINLL